jgi:hypothetical protein
MDFAVHFLFTYDDEESRARGRKGVPMTASHKEFVYLLIGASLLALPAKAQDVPPVVAAILKNWEQQTKLKPTYDKLDVDSSGNVTITNLSSSMVAGGNNPSVKITIGEMALEEISDAGGGLYEIGQAKFSAMKMEVAAPDGTAFTIDMPEGSAEGWFVKVLGDNPTPLDMMRSSMSIARRMSSGKMTANVMGQTISSEGYVSTWDGDPATGAGTFSTKIANVVIPEAAIAAIDPTGSLKQIGYRDLVFDMQADGTVTIVGESIGLDFSFAYAGKDMGVLKVSVTASDIPLAVYGELQKAQTMGQEPDFSALMPQLQNVSFGSFTFRFEDASLTKRLLPMAAAMQGMDEAAMVANAGAMVQLGLMQLNNQAFTDQVVGAVNAFLKDPKSITVALKPAAPVKVQQLMTLNPANPGAVINLLGVSVTAND